MGLMLAWCGTMSAASITFPFGQTVMFRGGGTYATFGQTIADYQGFDPGRRGTPIFLKIEMQLVTSAGYVTFSGAVNNIAMDPNTSVNRPYNTDGNGVLNLSFGISMSTYPSDPNCNEYKVRYKVSEISGLGGPGPFDQDWFEVKLVRNDYLSDASLLGAPDLFMQDNIKDLGDEPYTYATIPEITQSQDIWNRLHADDPTGTKTMELPQHATVSGNSDKFYFRIHNRGCATSPVAEIHSYWTIARTWELWGHDWHNYINNPSFAATNFCLDAGGAKEWLGNEMQLTDIYNYNSALVTKSVPAVAGGGTYIDYQSWQPPLPDWYPKTNPVLEFHGSMPVLCLLAVLRESGKPNQGMHFDPALNSNTYIQDFVSQNNNVVTRNSFLANPEPGFYKLGPDPLGNFSSQYGTVLVNNPVSGTRPVNIRIQNMGKPDISFGSYGNIYIAMDLELWNLWLDGGSKGSGVTVAGEGILKLTDFNTASLDNIVLPENAAYHIGMKFEYLAGQLPQADTDFEYVLGEYNPAGEGLPMLGTPSHYVTTVLASPQVCPDEEQDGSGSDLTAARQATYTGKTGTNSETNALALTLYPNPLSAPAQLNVNYNLVEAADVTIELYDFSGRRLDRNTAKKEPAGMHRQVVQMEAYPAGTYMIRLVTDHQQASKKFIFKQQE